MKKMKFIIFCSAVIAFNVITAFAQTSTRFGVKAGLTVATFDENNTNSILRFVVGGSFTYGLNKMLAVQPEMLYVWKGGRTLETPADLEAFRATFNTKYLEFPLLLRLTIPTTGKTTPHLLAGPYFSLFGFPKWKPKETDFGLSVGGAVDFNLGTRSITADVRYSHGLIDPTTITTIVTDDFGNELYKNSRGIKHRVFLLIVGISF